MYITQPHVELIHTCVHRVQVTKIYSKYTVRHVKFVSDTENVLNVLKILKIAWIPIWERIYH